MRMPGVGLIYAGLIAVLVAAASLIKPLAFLGIRTRPRGALVLGIGLIVAAVGAFLPARDTRVEAIRTHLDEFAPVFQFNEVHRIQVRAPRNRVYRAIKEVTADEILLFRTLTWLRRLGRPGPESILNAPERLPLQGLQEPIGSHRTGRGNRFVDAGWPEIPRLLSGDDLRRLLGRSQSRRSHSKDAIEFDQSGF
jgi:hypothetical protein